MCGILGIWAKNNEGKDKFNSFSKGLNRIAHRGPDAKNSKLYSNLILGHTRLAIIDTVATSNQPFLSTDNNYALVFNGEIYNYQELREALKIEGIHFRTDSDTEVLLEMLIRYKENALEKLNGFFSFAFYDVHKNELLVARDRLGIKPLYFYEDDNTFIFSSELGPFTELNISKQIDFKALNYYFSLTYIPAPLSIYKGIKKVNPGTFLKIRENNVSSTVFYNLSTVKEKISYEQAKKELYTLLEKSVSLRMIADVPLGCFLSGGLDSSIIAALAKKQNPALKTYSVGFDHPYFNESDYALEVAAKIDSNHTVFKLTKQDFKDNLQAFLNALDEPFGDSSAFAVFLLSQKTKKDLSVVLSGDGADELFGGYRKHQAELLIRNLSLFKKSTVRGGATLLKGLRSNRSDRIGEFNRKLQKFSKGLEKSPECRYWDWCQFIAESDRKLLLGKGFQVLKSHLKSIDWSSLDSILLADQTLVLPNDMLKKVDSMSMAHALEVRTPFLDHHVVEFVNALPIDYKLKKNNGKRILKDTFGHLLPSSILTRTKKGFEIPIKEWLADDIDAIFQQTIFSEEYIRNQNLFSFEFIQDLKKTWGDNSFGDRIYVVWTIICFQHWWDKTHKRNNNVNSHS